MASFDAQVFVDDPSVDRLNACRKADLFAIAEHYGLVVPTQVVKCKLLESVVSGLVDMQVLGGGDGAAPSTPGVVGQAVSTEDKPITTLPRYDPSPISSSGSGDPRLRLRLARLQFEAQEKQSQADYRHRLEVRRMEIEAEKEVQLRRLELEVASAEHSTPHRPGDRGAFDVSKHISLVPPFREAEVDSYFSAFERIASSLRWPNDVWPLLLQCKLTGKAQEVLAALSLEDGLRYDVVKNTVLRAYELVPEAYRQKFRNHRKLPEKDLCGVCP